MHEACLVDGADRPYAHGAGRELPEVGHQIRMRVTGQAARAIHGTAQLLPVMCQVVLVKTPFKVGPCVYARRAVRLQENQVAGMRARGVAKRMEKMIETNLEQVGRDRKSTRLNARHKCADRMTSYDGK